MNIYRLVFFYHFSKYVLLFLEDKMDGKFNVRVFLSICLTFNQFQPDVAYKSVAYKKSVYIKQNIIMAMLRKVNSHSVDICKLIKKSIT